MNVASDAASTSDDHPLDVARARPTGGTSRCPTAIIAGLILTLAEFFDGDRSRYVYQPEGLHDLLLECFGDWHFGYLSGPRRRPPDARSTCLYGVEKNPCQTTASKAAVVSRKSGNCLGSRSGIACLQRSRGFGGVIGRVSPGQRP